MSFLINDWFCVPRWRFPLGHYWDGKILATEAVALLCYRSVVKTTRHLSGCLNVKSQTLAAAVYSFAAAVAVVINGTFLSIL